MPDFKKLEYKVPVDVIRKVSDALRTNWFSSDGEEEYNNDDVIEASKELDAIIEEQDSQ